MAQPPLGITFNQAVQVYADEFEQLSARIELLKPVAATGQLAKRSFHMRHVFLNHTQMLAAMRVNLAIDVRGGTVSVLPLRDRGGVIQDPLKMYATAGTEVNKGLRHDLTYAGVPEVVTQSKVPTVLNFPRQTTVRPRTRSTVEPFSPAGAQPYAEVVHPARLAAINPPVTTYDNAILTQLRVQGPPSHLFYSQGQQDDRSLGAPWSLDTTYLLLTLSVADNSISPFRVLFRSRILSGPNLTYQQIHLNGKPASYIVSRANADSDTVEFVPFPPVAVAAPRTLPPTLWAPPEPYTTFSTRSEIQGHFLPDLSGYQNFPHGRGNNSHSLGHRQQKIYRQRRASGENL